MAGEGISGLANLEPAEPGNTRAVTHGAHSERLVGPVAEDEILEIRRDRPRGRTLEGGSLGDEVWVIHDLAIRLADAEARAARAEARLDELTKGSADRDTGPTALEDTDGG